LAWVLGSGGSFGDGYGDNLTGQLVASTETIIRREIAEWINNDLSYSVLLDNLQRSVFSRRRADVIATTETTRAFASANRIAWRDSGVITRMRWQTSFDEKVCNICSPLNGQTTDINGDFGGYFPPAHVSCRCFISPVIASLD